MGIQVHVELKDLPESFKREIVKEQYLRNDYEPTDTLYVTFPKSGRIMSYCDDILVFDNKNANMQFKEELDEHNVPYVRC